MKMRRTHKGLMFGIVPIYLDMTDAECPIVEPRLGFGLLLSLCQMLHDAATVIATVINPEFEPVFEIKITDEIK